MSYYKLTPVGEDKPWYFDRLVDVKEELYVLDVGDYELTHQGTGKKLIFRVKKLPLYYSYRRPVAWNLLDNPTRDDFVLLSETFRKPPFLRKVSKRWVTLYPSKLGSYLK